VLVPYVCKKNQKSTGQNEKGTVVVDLAMQDNVYILPSREPSEPGHTPAHNLPVQLTPLIGREREVEAICTLLRRPEVRLLTIVGTGGIGKTRLGLQVASDLLDAFSDGECLVLLAPISDPELVVSTISQTLGVKEDGARPLLGLLKDHLQDKDLLLMLDNFEQVVAAAPLLTELLEACPSLKVLVTSRELLRVRGEQEFPLSPLAFPDLKHLPSSEVLAQYGAVALFIQRAQAVKPDFQLTDANANSIAALCIRLDGLPLAIELAAARLKHLSLQGLLARLEHRLQLLTQGPRDVDARQQTLRNTIQWSYDLLSDQEQLLFRRLSVFVGGCTLEAAESLYTVLGGETIHVFDRVTSLIDKSLLQQNEQDENSGEESRYAMLETIREYGLDCLTTRGEREVIQEAHSAFYLRLAETAEPELRGSQQAAWFDRLEREHDNFRAALHFLLERDKGEMALRLGGALHWFWFVRLHRSEGWTLLERALATRDEVTASVRANALWAAGNLAGPGNVDRAEVLCKQSLTLFQEIRDKAGMGAASLFLGRVAEWKSQPLQARTLYEKSVALSREVGVMWVLALSLHLLAQLSLYAGDYASSCLLAEESLAFYRKSQDKRGMCSTQGLLAGVYFFTQGDVSKAQDLAEESLAISREIGYKGDEGRALHGLGALFDYQGKPEMARVRLEESLVIWNELGDKEGMGDALTRLARVEAHQENLTAARTLYKQSLALLSERNHTEIATCLEGLAGVVAAFGELTCAGQLWGAAEALRETTGELMFPVYRAEYEYGVASARETLGEQAFAVAWAQGRSMTPKEALAAEERVVLPQLISIESSSTLQAKPKATYPDGLTAREVEVLRFIAQGLTDTLIAEQLIISPRTVNTHLTSIYSKIQVSSRSAATRYAIDHHLV
jgi:predicted ATPase/DNA-binding CsgD family transcriptional regulator